MRKILCITVIVALLVGSLANAKSAEAASVYRIDYAIIEDLQTGQIKSLIEADARLKFIKSGLFHVSIPPGMAVAMIRRGSGLEGTVRWHGFETLRTASCGDVLLLPLLDMNRYISITPQGRCAPDITIRVFIRE